MSLAAPPASPLRRASAAGAGGGLLRWSIIAVVGLAVFGPAVALQLKTIAGGRAGFTRASQLPGLESAITNTVVLAIGSVVIALVLGVMLARWSARLDGRFAGVLRMIPILPLVTPAVASVVGWSFLLSPNVGYVNQVLRLLPFWSGLSAGPVNVYTMPWIMLITGLGLASFAYLFIYEALQAMGGELDAAARTSGARGLRRFLRIELPLLRPALVYAAGTTLMIGIGQFTAPLLLGRRSNINTLTILIFNKTAEPPVDWTVTAVLGLPFLLLGAGILIFQRWALRNRARFRVHGRSDRYPVEGGHAGLWVILYGAVTVGLPLAALVRVALSPFWSGQLSLGDVTLRHVIAVVFDNPLTSKAIITSIVCALIASLIVLPLGFACAILTTGVLGRGEQAAKVLDVVTSLPLVVPAALSGASFLFLYSARPFQLYGTRILIIIAYVTLMIPHAVRTQSASLLTLREEYAAAARVAGAGPLRTLLRVILPLVRGGLAGGAALIFVLLSHEFAASAMLRSARTQVMGTALYDVWSTGSYPQVAALALVMTVVTAIGVAVALALGGQRALSTVEQP